MSNERIRKLQSAVQALEAKGVSSKSLEYQLRQLIRDQQRNQARQAKQSQSV